MRFMIMMMKKVVMTRNDLMVQMGKMTFIDVG
jgi:hypothetical protein